MWFCWTKDIIQYDNNDNLFGDAVSLTNRWGWFYSNRLLLIFIQFESSNLIFYSYLIIKFNL